MEKRTCHLIKMFLQNKSETNPDSSSLTQWMFRFPQKKTITSRTKTAPKPQH